MATPNESLLHYLRRLAAPAADAGDAVMLERFVSQGDESAFTALLARHGPMVLSVCRHILRNSHDAEDAFQATFLVLARKAAALRRPEALASWLYGTARHLAFTSRRAALRRQHRETRCQSPAAPPPQGDVLDDLSARELLLALDEELERLPETYRLPLILCYLEGRTREEAARLLGWTANSVKGRLERGRKQLQARLSRRGLELGTGLLALESMATAPVSAALQQATVQGALRFAAGSAEGIAASVLSLAETGVTSMTMMKAKAGLLLLFALCFAGGTGVLAYSLRSEKPAQKKEATATKVQEAKNEIPNRQENKKPNTDRFGDPLPPAAIARLGTVRFRHGSTVTGLAFLPDGKTILSGSYDKTLRLWDAASGRELKRFPPTGGSIKHFSLSKDGKFAAAIDYVQDLYLVRIPTGQLVRYNLSSPDASTCVALSPDGNILADAAAKSFHVRLWDRDTGKLLRQCDGHKGIVQSAVFAPDGKTLATGAADGTVRLWDVATGKQLLDRDNKHPVASVNFSPDGRILAAGGDGKAQFWELPAGKRLREAEVGSPWIVKTIVFSPDGKVVAAAGNGSFIYLWELATGKELRRIRDWPDSLAFSPDGKTLASGGTHCTIHLWDTTTGKEKTAALSGGHGSIHSLAVSGDGKLAATSGGGTIRLWETASGREIRSLQSDFGAVALSPDGKILASGRRLWDATTGATLGELKRPNYLFFSAMAFSPDGRTLALGVPDAFREKNPTIQLWDVAQIKELKHFGELPVHSLSYSPDGKTVATGHGEGVICFWDTASGRELRRIKGHQREVRSIAFSPDGKTLASCTFNGDIFLWDTASGKRVRTFVRVAPLQCLAIAFAPNGKMLASAEGPWLSEESITLWEVATGQVRSRLKGHQGDVNCLVFASDSRTLISSSTDTTALVWDVLATSQTRQGKPGRLSPAQMDALWADLLIPDAARSYQVMRTLAASPESVKYLGQRLAPAPADKNIPQLIKDLNSDEFAIRDNATAALSRLGDTAMPALRKALQAAPSPEARRRLQQLLDDLAPAWLRTLRSLETLEYFGSSEARQVLAMLAGGASEARLTQEAKASLARLAARAALRR